MLPEATPPVADILSCLTAESHPVLLVPASEAGWFAGEHLACFGPRDVRTDLDIDEAAAVLQATFESVHPSVAVALIPYDGPCRVHVYTGGYTSDDGVVWEEWGSPSTLPSPRTFSPPSPVLASPASRSSESDYTGAVGQIHEAISSGDVYVLNLTYVLEGKAASTYPGELLASLHWRFGADMSAMLAWPGGGIVSVSPERFLSLQDTSDGWVAMVSPIKGTRPRDPSPDEDTRLADELRSSDKERAEHIMIVDLERNDLNVVCVPGTVRVPRLFDVVGTPYCHQMVSDVTGIVREDVGLDSVLRAMFPCGSVTGAPKRAAMRIIGELENCSRGAYTGSLVVARPGRLDSSVLIRTLELGPGESGRWGTGCGITIDSDPAEEWAESLLKARPATT